MDPRNPSLHRIWEKECRRRQKQEIEASRKADEESEILQEEDHNQLTIKRLCTAVSKMFIKKEEPKEPERYENGVYVNHVAGLQKGWFDEEGKILDRSTG